MQSLKFPRSLDLVAQWTKPLLIGYIACWSNGLRALAGGSNPGLEVFFQLDWTSGHAEIKS